MPPTGCLAVIGFCGGGNSQFYSDRINSILKKDLLYFNTE